MFQFSIEAGPVPIGTIQMRIEPTFSPAEKTSKASITTIEHEPLGNSGPTKTFGKRQKTKADASVSKDFFAKRTSSSTERQVGERRLNDDTTDGFLEFLLTSGLPIRALAAVFAIALMVPMTFIAITERQSHDGIDRITTASINKEAGFEINDVSMTKLIKSQETIVSVYGRVENNSADNRPLKPLWITLYDKDGRVVQSWRHQIKKPMINSGQTFRFMTSAIDYSGKAKQVTVSTTQKK